MTPEQQAVIEEAEKMAQFLIAHGRSPEADNCYRNIKDLLILAKDLEKENKTLRGALIKREEIFMEEITDDPTARHGVFALAAEYLKSKENK